MRDKIRGICGIPIDPMIVQARSLASPVGENPEYNRGMAELIASCIRAPDVPLEKTAHWVQRLIEEGE